MSKLGRVLTVKADKTKEVKAAIKHLVENEVLVGIPSDPKANIRKPDNGKQPKATNAEIGYRNENGDPEYNIPARPHLVPGVRDALPQTTEYLKQGAQLALSGKATAVDRALNAAGVAAVNSVRAKLTNGPFAPLSQRTLEARLAKGRTGTSPLIDTTQYRTAQTYVIRKRNS